MTWFRTDDGWHKHRKRIRTGLDLEGLAAQGLWLAAGTWSADELTDGWVPAYIVDYLAPGVGRDLAKRLERGGLWEPDMRDGDDGWQFHEWTHHQPTREEIMAQREKKADGGKVGNHRRWHVAKGVTDPRCPYCRLAPESDPTRTSDRTTDPTPDRMSQESRTPDQMTDRYTDGISDRSSESGPNPPDPARPDPARPVVTDVTTSEDQNPLPHASRSVETGSNSAEMAIPGTEVILSSSVKASPAKRGTRLPEGWMPSDRNREWARREYPGVDLRMEHTKFTNHWLSKTGRDATKVDWDRTWQNWIINAADRIGPRAKTPLSLADGRQVHRKTAAHVDHLNAYGDPDA